MEKSILRKPSDIKDVFGAFLLEGSQFSIFEDLDVLGKQRLRHVHAVGRLGEIQLLRKLQEFLQIRDLHPVYLLSVSYHRRRQI